MPSTSVCVRFPKEGKGVIATDNLLLRHDGVVYTHPECMKGVPVEKVNRDHPYWEKCWPDLQKLVKQTQQFWTDRYNAVRDSNENVKRYYYNRQVNRGTAILAFLADGKVSPFQLLSKKHVKVVGKGSISSYDTLYQLCHTMEELLRFKLDVEPIDWLRQRLHELIEEQGPRFKLSRTVRGFYHDPELAVLRAKSGFMRIGRPPGRVRGGETRRAVKHRASHLHPKSVPVLKTVARLPGAASDKSEGYDKGRNNVNTLPCPETKDSLLSKGRHANCKDLSKRNLSEHPNSASSSPRDIANVDWQLARLSKAVAGHKKTQDLQLCRAKDMEMVNQKRLSSYWCSRTGTYIGQSFP